MSIGEFFIDDGPGEEEGDSPDAASKFDWPDGAELEVTPPTEEPGDFEDEDEGEGKAWRY